MLCYGHGSLCASSLTSSPWHFSSSCVYFCGMGEGETVFSMQFVCPALWGLSCGCIWCVHKAYHGGACLRSRFDVWLNWWNGSRPSSPSKCAFNLSDKMHTTGLCVREVFLFGRWSKPPYSLSLVNSGFYILCATLCIVYFIFSPCFAVYFGLSVFCVFH